MLWSFQSKKQQVIFLTSFLENKVPQKKKKTQLADGHFNCDGRAVHRKGLAWPELAFL